MSYPILEQAAKSVTTNSAPAPSAENVVSDLLSAEKMSKQERIRYSFEQLVGTWRLCFITGTKKTRHRAGIVLGAGRYVPKFIKIHIDYAATTVEQQVDAGTVENCVVFGGIKISLTGITKFLPNKNILAFDFTRMTVSLFGATVYKGYIRGGEAKEKTFYDESVGKQAFFTYFLIENEIIAARGRGGGLALWSRQQ